MGNREFPVHSHGSGYISLIAADIQYYPKKTYLEIRVGRRANLKTVRIRRKRYRVRTLRFPRRKQRFFRRGPNRVSRKYNRLVHKKRTKVSAYRYLSGSFILPIRGMRRRRLYFGDYRKIYRGRHLIKKYYHRGIDYGAPVGTRVRSCNAGKVVLARRLHKRGKAVIVDHGWGVYSEYLHLSRISVRKGQWVHRGQMVGRVGNTGVSTGPHLHWSVLVNGILVNPLTWTYRRIARIFPRRKKKGSRLTYLKK